MTTQKVRFDQGVPTSGGLYLCLSRNTYESDGKRAMTAVWVFLYGGVLHFMPHGYDCGRTLAEFPFLQDVRWSRRLEADLAVSPEEPS